MLSAPINDPDRVVLVASKGGAPAHPAWYLNLQDDPTVRLMRRGRTERMVARTADPDERDALWLEVVAAYRGYAGYQRHTDRTIPVVILTPDTTDGQGQAT